MGHGVGMTVVTPQRFRLARDGAYLTRAASASLFNIPAWLIQRWEREGPAANDVETFDQAFAVLAERADREHERTLAIFAKHGWAPPGSWRDQPDSVADERSRRKRTADRADTSADILAGNASSSVYRLVRCDRCGSPPDQPCVGPQGRRGTWHVDRRQSALRAVQAFYALAFADSPSRRRPTQPDQSVGDLFAQAMKLLEPELHCG